MGREKKEECLVQRFYALRFILLLLAVMCVGCLFSQTARAEWADWVYNYSLDAGFEDNINFAVGNEGRLSDVFLSPSVVVGKYYQAGDYTRLRFALDLTGRVYKRYEGLDSLLSGAEASLIHKFGVGQGVPWVKVRGFAGYMTVNKSMRNSWVYQGEVTFGKRFSERFDMQLSYNFMYRNGRELGPQQQVKGFKDNPFDQVGNKGSVAMNYLLTQDILASLGYSLYYGDIASTNDPSKRAQFVNFTKALIWDNTYDNNRLCTYRFKALTHQFTAGMSYALSGHSSVNASYTRVDGYTSDVHYYDNLVLTNFKYNFY